ncbi:MAG TPA: hypothetical protein VF571_09210 [Pyrinomonadaceae bacterium]|jgi:hypothetical protein
MKYLFTAQFNDGEEYRQTTEDKSLTTEGKSAFYDIKDRDIKTFKLEGDGHTYLVDLTDGHFEIDGVPFGAGKPVLADEPLRLIYFRRNYIHHAGTEILGHDIDYFMGWQTTVNDKNYQQIIQIA